MSGCVQVWTGVCSVTHTCPHVSSKRIFTFFMLNFLFLSCNNALLALGREIMIWLKISVLVAIPSLSPENIFSNVHRWVKTEWGTFTFLYVWIFCFSFVTALCFSLLGKISRCRPPGKRSETSPGCFYFCMLRSSIKTRDRFTQNIMEQEAPLFQTAST